EGELEQLRSFATVLPGVFLGVAAFLLNVVLFRLIQLHRSQIATLKAVGYTDRRIGIYYLQLAGVIVLIGIGVGTGLGVVLGRGLTELYAEFFRIPVLAYRLQGSVFATAALISIVAAVTGALRGVFSIVRMPPAEAMRPPAPATYRTSLLERLRLQRVFGESARMIVREISRAPLRALISGVAIAFAMAITITGRFGYDMIEEFVELQFEGVMREDLTLVYAQPEGNAATRELARLPGVLRAEGLRIVPARLRSGNQWRDVALFGYPEGSELRQLLDNRGRVHDIPSEGVVLTRLLAEILGVELGDRVRAEVREGRRPTLSLSVAGVVDDPVGLNGHMSLTHLSTLLREAPRVSAGLLRVAPGATPVIRERADQMPGVVDVSANSDLVARFHEQTGEYFWAMTLILSAFAAAIAVGVIYNNARVMLSTRQRDLASLRVLGFTRREIAAIMIGELSLQVALAIPFGFLLGKWGAAGVMATVHPERFRFPAVVGADTYGFAVLVVVGSALIAGLLVRRRVYHMDLIGVLKTRE
ncbi:MAG: FtsX-like permease family protein, partial [Gemmatimonadetes bacterium]|nr:FtsX-like permease family protein [Gemmatimonadota bacterium]